MVNLDFCGCGPADCTTDLPVLKLTTMSIRKIVSERQLKAIQRVLRSSLKNEMATGRMMRLATSSSNIHRSQ